MTQTSNHNLHTLVTQGLATDPLWQTQLTFYQTLGSQAWNQNVPYLVTNTWHMAQVVADCAWAFILDQQNSHGTSNFCILELGTGLGIFTHRLSECLKRHHDNDQPKNIHIQYLVTDASKQVISCLKHQPQLKPYAWLSYEFIDLAFCPGTKLPDTLTTLIQGKVVFVVANYFFDSLFQSAYYLNHGKLTPAQIAPYDETFHPVFKPQTKAQPPYYRPFFLNQVLHSHQHLETNRFTIPDAALIMLHALIDVSAQLCLIVNDKGHTTLNNDSYDEHFDYCQDGAWSSSINFYALSQFFKHYGAQEWLSHATHQHESLDLITGCWLVSSLGNPSQHSKLNKIAEKKLIQHSPARHHQVLKSLLTDQANLNLEAIMTVCNHDPEVLLFLIQRYSLQTSDLLNLKRQLHTLIDQLSFHPTYAYKHLVKNLVSLSHIHPYQPDELDKLMRLYPLWFGADEFYHKHKQPLK